MKTFYYILPILFLLASCKKDTEEKETISFVVTCNDCTISYTGDDGSDILESNIKSTFTKHFTGDIDFEITSTSLTEIQESVTRHKGDGFTSVFGSKYTKGFHITYSSALRSINDGSGSGSQGTIYGCGLYNGKTLYLGSRGGCYYITSGGNKSYVDRSYCKCN